MDDSSTMLTLMIGTTTLNKHGPDILLESTLYRYIVRAFQNVTLTRLKFLSLLIRLDNLLPPLEAHWKVVKCILRYIQSTSQFGLLLQSVLPSCKLSLRAYSDLDWASDPYNLHSTSGSYIFLGPNMVS